jgi:hypothetical protein
LPKLDNPLLVLEPSRVQAAEGWAANDGIGVSFDCQSNQRLRNALSLRADAVPFEMPRTLRSDAPVFEPSRGIHSEREQRQEEHKDNLVGSGSTRTDCSRLHQSKVDIPELLDVWSLSCEKHGCWLVQQRFEDGTVEEKSRLAEQLRGHIWQAVRDPHANYVVQKCIMSTPPSTSQFIVDELCNRSNGAVEAARHRYGCRIVQRLLELKSPAGGQMPWMSTLVDGILTDLVALCSNAYGNYVIQHLIEYGKPDQKQYICETLEQHVGSLAGDNCAHAVMCKALDHCSHADRRRLANALHPYLHCLKSNVGRRAAQQVYKILAPQVEEAFSQPVGAQLHHKLKHGKQSFSHTVIVD